MPGAASFEPEYVAARRVLLDALDALGAHRKAVVLVGAQAIYLHVGDGDLAVSPYTTDGDLVIDPRELDDEPELANSPRSGRIRARATSGKLDDGRSPDRPHGPRVPGRSRTPGGSTRSTRDRCGAQSVWSRGAVVDHALARVGAMDPIAERAFDVNVAGVAALLVAKLHKINERQDDTARRQDKDGLDVLRLLRFADTAHLATTLTSLAEHPIAGAVTRHARTLLNLFSDRNAVGAVMAVRASVGLEDERVIAASCEALSRRLLDAWK